MDTRTRGERERLREALVVGSGSGMAFTCKAFHSILAVVLCTVYHLDETRIRPRASTSVTHTEIVPNCSKL